MATVAFNIFNYTMVFIKIKTFRDFGDPCRMGISLF